MESHSDFELNGKLKDFFAALSFDRAIVCQPISDIFAKAEEGDAEDDSEMG